MRIIALYCKCINRFLTICYLYLQFERPSNFFSLFSQFPQFVNFRYSLPEYGDPVARPTWYGRIASCLWRTAPYLSRKKRYSALGNNNTEIGTIPPIDRNLESLCEMLWQQDNLINFTIIVFTIIVFIIIYIYYWIIYIYYCGLIMS